MSDTLENSLSEEEEVQETKKTRKRSRKEGGSSASEASSAASAPDAPVGSSLSEEEEKPKKKRKARRSSSRVAPSDTSNVVKYRLTFLMDQRFKGEFYRKGDTLEVPEHVFNAYKQRRRLLEFKKM